MKKHLKKKWMLPMGMLVMLLSSNASVNCPEHSEFPVLLPHEFDNTKYYQCVDGEAVECDCPYGLVFDPALSVCGWPY